MKELMLKQRVFKLIDDKNEDFMKLGNHLNVVSDIIKQLNKFIDGEVELSNKGIDELLGILIQYRVVLDIPIPVDTMLLRGVKFEDPTKYLDKYTNTSRISYIPKDISYKAKLNRFNKENQPMYYGSIAKSILNANVVFSEIEAKENEFINLLVSKTSEELNVRYIGLFEYYRRGTQPPIIVHSFFQEVYDYYKSTHEKELLMAIELCDTFFSDITTREGTDRLYMVTAMLSNILLEDKQVDGLIYPSVVAANEPNLVLKPNSVDAKVRHENVYIKRLSKDYGYSIYYAINYNDGNVDKNNDINWKKP